jgi:hypothetical protein
MRETPGYGWTSGLVEALGLQPPDVRGNGLPAVRWVMIADVTPARADALLTALGAAGVPARAARIQSRSLRDVDTRVWVDPDRLARAENVLMATLAASGAAGCSAAGGSSEPDGCGGSVLFDSLTVDRLRSSWGFCTGHAWLYLCLETEMTTRPAASAGICQDLTVQAVRLLEERRRPRRRLRAFAGVERCLLCEYGTAPDPFERLVTAELTRGWLARSAVVWLRRRCPSCLPHVATAGGVVCRLHVSRRDLSGRVLRDYLGDLGERLGGCETDGEAAVVEAVGWFAGWHPAAGSIGT